jgi:hypothetical protein
MSKSRITTEKLSPIHPGEVLAEAYSVRLRTSGSLYKAHMIST